MMNSQPRFLQGVYAFSGAGLETPTPIAADLSYVVPADRRAQLIYFRAGNSSPELVYILLLRDGKVMRLFPVGAKSHVHVQLAVVEDLFAATQLDLRIAAHAEVSGSLVLDIGLLEI